MPVGALLLADRMTGIDAKAGSMGKGRLWTETDVRENSWYLHDGRMPAGIMIESGQADLFLISWQGVEWKVGAKKVKMDDLFARTVLYKVGHHGSHNATMKEHGLEKMTHRDLIALIPVSKAMAKKKKWKMPFEPLHRRLLARTRGRVLLADADELPPEAALLTKLTPSERRRFREMVATTELFHDISIPL